MLLLLLLDHGIVIKADLRPDVAVQAYTASTREVEAGGSESSLPTEGPTVASLSVFTRMLTLSVFYIYKKTKKSDKARLGHLKCISKE